MNRRHLLRGLGGAAIAAPFLSSVVERAARSQSLPFDAPKRLIVMFTHYGCLTDRWFPTKSHGELGAADYQRTSLEPLAAYAPKLLMPRGIRAMNEWSFEGTYGQTTDPHSQVCGSYFTCQPVTPDFAKFDCKPMGRSLDHVCAEQVDPSGKPLFIQIGGVRGNANNTQDVISWEAAEQMFPGVGDPRLLFANLTNLFGKGPTSPDTYRLLRGESAVDVFRDDIASLKRVNMSGSDQRKLDAWTSLLDETSREVTSQCSEAVAQSLGLTDASVEEAATSALDKASPVMLDLVTLSALCDTNRVIFFKYPSSYVFSFLGLNKDSSGLSHRIGTAFMGGTCLEDWLEMITTMDRWYAEQFAYLVKRLDSFDEGDVKLLDNTATVWFQEMSDGNSHNLNNIPIIQAGSCGGYFKVGGAVNVDGGSADMTPGHSSEDCVDGISMDLDAMGTPPDVASMPINKYYCNLMNAIGVKAGADGFPVLNGDREVSHFGRYDDTRLFNGGGTNAPRIDNPGEYSELRASG